MVMGASGTRIRQAYLDALRGSLEARIDAVAQTQLEASARALAETERLVRSPRLIATVLSGDREAEVRYLAAQVGITEVLYSKSPEEKVAIVRAETALAPTLFVGDGINDAPAMQAATVGIAFGQHSDVTAEAAGAVVLETSLQKVDELIHIGQRLRRIALQCAVGGMALSLIGMLAAAAGYLPPVAGAIAQEFIDLVAVLNALRMALPPGELSDINHA